MWFLVLLRPMHSADHSRPGSWAASVTRPIHAGNTCLGASFE
ncbi:Uncharacterised protein [Mycobacterium tuberculosis]|uniref:Uncharacterized protein n=1 Tax=Mycobacterium tuberculosis TaxID=1773 RepID=A0A916LHM4_MYCTX|nr:Uncharacterised protein [Mycobacterium tuberculosis]CPC78429.1 Uncharacterised protein [Mycobacterium tuberculosis]